MTRKKLLFKISFEDAERNTIPYYGYIRKYVEFETKLTKQDGINIFYLPYIRLEAPTRRWYRNYTHYCYGNTLILSINKPKSKAVLCSENSNNMEKHIISSLIGLRKEHPFYSNFEIKNKKRYKPVIKNKEGKRIYYFY